MSIGTNADIDPSHYREAERIVRTRGRLESAKLCAALLSEVYVIPLNLRHDEACRPVTGPDGDPQSLYRTLADIGWQLSAAQAALLATIIPALAEAGIEGSGIFMEAGR